MARAISCWCDATLDLIFHSSRRPCMDRRHFVASLGAMAAGAAGLNASAAYAQTQASIAERLAAYAASLTYDDLDDETIETVRTHLADALGCGVAALDEKPVAIARKVALANGGGDGARSSVLGSRRRTSPELATFANGAAIRYYDLNDVYAGKEIGHPSDNVSACLAQAQAEQAHGRDLIVSIVLAY